MNHPDPHALIDAIYAGILAPDGLNRGLQVFRNRFGIEFSYLLLWDRATDLIRVVGAAGLIPELQAAYESHYQFQDPAKADFSHIAEGNWWIDTEKLGLARMEASAFYQEFFRAYEMSSYMSSPVFRSSEMEIALSLLRSRSEGVFTRGHAVEIQPYVTHLRRAVLLRERMGELASAADLTESLLERLPFGVAVIDYRLRVLALNERGRRGLTSFGPASRWHQPIPGSGHSLEQMIREACKTRDPASVQAVMFRTSAQVSFNVLVLPLTADHRLSGGWQRPAALMIFSEIRPPTRLLPDILRELYGLNRSEARLALSLADGSGLPAVAASLRITRETARSTLKIVFRKTGASSQSQLVKLLAALTVIDTAR